MLKARLVFRRLAMIGLAVVALNGWDVSLAQQAPETADEAPSPAANIQNLERPTATAPSTAADDQAAILRAQLEVMREYHSTMTSTVYWALGVVGGLTLALLAFASYVNLRVSDRERDALRADLLGHTDQSLAELSRSLQTKSTELFRDQSKAFEVLREQLESGVRAHLDNANEEISKAVSGIDKDITRRIAPIAKSIQSIERQLLDQQLEAIELEAGYWELKKVKANELAQWLNYGVAAANSQHGPDSWRVQRCLEKIDEALVDGFEADHRIASKVDELMAALKGNFPVTASRIREKITRA